MENNLPNYLWILSEERPKENVLKEIFKIFLNERQGFFCDTIRILPILSNGRFTFTYEVTGLRSNIINKVYIKIVKGKSSFVDFLIFYQHKEPLEGQCPLFVIEETKTDDGESRNTGVYQRASKFVYIEYFYPNIDKYMLYNFQITPKEKSTETNIFGTRLLLTIGVKIIGKNIDNYNFRPFETIDEVIDFKNNMRKPPAGNTPILIYKELNSIVVTGRLEKSGTLSHDPNIGAISLICFGIRKLGYKGEIILKDHGLNETNFRGNNKFLFIALRLSLKFLLNGSLVSINQIALHNLYWHYEQNSEKLGTIFIHIVVESFTNGYSIFENHAGCEKGYFYTSYQSNPIPLEKYKDKIAYKNGDKMSIVHIPDLILIDVDRLEIINCEGKTFDKMYQGIEELKNYDTIEQFYIKKYYPKFKILRTVILYGGNNQTSICIEVGFLLTDDGFVILGIQAPDLFQKAIRNLFDFWKQC